MVNPFLPYYRLKRKIDVFASPTLIEIQKTKNEGNRFSSIFDKVNGSIWIDFQCDKQIG